MSSFSANEYFDLLDFINKSFLKAKFPRLSALLQNLFERRSHKWQKHLSVAEGPKKLKDLEKENDEEENAKGNKEKK